MRYNRKYSSSVAMSLRVKEKNHPKRKVADEVFVIFIPVTFFKQKLWIICEFLEKNINVFYPEISFHFNAQYTCI